MFCCNKCEKSFKTNWQLRRHINKKIPCVKKIQVNSIKDLEKQVGTQEMEVETQKKSKKQVGTQKMEVETQKMEVETQEMEVETQEDILNKMSKCDDFSTAHKCKYCLKEITRKTNCTKHEQQCPLKFNEIRRLEIEANVNVNNRTPKMCRYCMRSFSKVCNATRHMKTCPKKESYKTELLSRLQRNESVTHITNDHSINNSNNITNITNNNIINVNSIGQEDLSYMTCAVIKKIMKNTKSPQEFVAKTLAYIHAHADHPENHNIIFSNYRSNSALVKSDDKYEFKNINAILKEATCNWLDKVCIDDDYDELPKRIKQKYENTCEDDELDQTAKSMIKLELYTKHKNGVIKKR